MKNFLSAGIVSIIFFIAQLIISVIVLYFFLITQTQSYLKTITQRTRDDIIYNNGQWDLFSYNGDPNLPDTHPLYVISLDGFIIDRWRPVHGFLDKSNISRLLTYQTPETINTSTKENWRIFSEPVTSGNKIIGVVTVSKFAPDAGNLEQVDTILSDNAKIIYAKLRIHNNIIDVSQIDIRSIPFDIAYEIVDQFNTVLLKNNNANSMDNLPDFIDRSYVGDVLSLPEYLEIKDTITNEPFLMNNLQIKDKQNNIVGIISAGKSIGFIYETIKNFVLIDTIAGLFLSSLLIHFINRSFRRNAGIRVKEAALKERISKISFSKKESKLVINDTAILVPFATNQYFLCERLFSNPKKRWETDELLERFGEHDLTKWHTVYDARRLMNQRLQYILPDNLIILKNKTYQINPMFHNIIS